MGRYENMINTYIRYSFVWIYIFTLHILHLLIVKVVTQTRVRCVSRMLPSIYQVTIKTIQCAYEPSFWVADALEFTHRLIHFFSLEIMSQILLYNSEFFIKRRAFRLFLISSKMFGYISSKCNVSTGCK